MIDASRSSDSGVSFDRMRPDAARTARISVRSDPNVLRAIDRVARRHHRTISDQVRHVMEADDEVREELRRDAEEPAA
ncbi:MAG: hypothetical protein DLM64_06105 [Solirubrobacterales bacterium]|nr:MAG: hypothetical protein DLM64_06105 [Solirubrobacterales bacterium]